MADLRYDTPLAGATVSTKGQAGVWMRAYGGREDLDFSTSLGSDAADRDFSGLTLGVDFEVGTNMVMGLLIGAGRGDLDFASGSNADYDSKSVGIYATYMKDGFFIDALLKSDRGDLDYTTSTEVGDATFSTDYNALGLIVDTGKRFAPQGNSFIEPKATLSISRTQVDNTNIGVNDILFDDGNSVLGRVGARYGTLLPKMGVEAWVEASLWNEFDGDQTLTIDGGTGATISHDGNMTFGEIAFGANIYNQSSGWSGFAKGAYTFGEDLNGFAVQAGARIRF